jgi:hypothetical protein
MTAPLKLHLHVQLQNARIMRRVYLADAIVDRAAASV